MTDTAVSTGLPGHHTYLLTINGAGSNPNIDQRLETTNNTGVLPIRA